MNTKGSGIVFIKQFLKKNGYEQQVLEQLTAEEKKQYQAALSISWVPNDLETKVTCLYANLTMPADPDRYIKIGNQMAKIQIGGLYQAVFKLFTVPFLVTKAAQYWRTLNDEGSIEAFASKGKKEMTMILKDCPDLKEDTRRLYQGYFQGAVEMTGAKDVQVTQDQTDAPVWKWIIRWK
jgi:hypothetical protein